MSPLLFIVVMMPLTLYGITEDQRWEQIGKGHKAHQPSIVHGQF